MDILRPAPKKLNGNQYVLVMVDRYSELMRAVPRTKTNMSHIASPFMGEGTILYGARARVLKDNGTQFVIEFIKSLRAFLGTGHMTTMSYHHQTSKQKERLNNTFITRLQHCAAEQQREWDIRSQPLSYTYNSEVHCTANLSPLRLALSQKTPCWPIEVR